MITTKELATTGNQPPATPAASIESIESVAKNYTARLTRELQILAALRQAEFQIRANLKAGRASLDEYLDIWSSEQIVAETSKAVRDQLNDTLDTVWHVLNVPDAVDGTVSNVSGTINWYAVAATTQTALAATHTAHFCTNDKATCSSCLHYSSCTLTGKKSVAVATVAT